MSIGDFRVDYYGGMARALAGDGDGFALTNMPFLTRLSHDGMVYTVEHNFTVLGAGSDADILIQVGSRPMHMYDITVSVDAGPDDFYMYEGPTFSAAGTALTVHNQNRGSTLTSAATATHSPTVSATGTLLKHDTFATAGNKTAAIPSVDQSVWVLAADTDYLFRFNNGSQGNENVDIHFYWYEMQYKENSETIDGR